jgi:hypothetical protein
MFGSNENTVTIYPEGWELYDQLAEMPGDVIIKAAGNMGGSMIVCCTTPRQTGGPGTQSIRHTMMSMSTSSTAMSRRVADAVSRQSMFRAIWRNGSTPSKLRKRGIVFTNVWSQELFQPLSVTRRL